jgi:MerR family transcriptional regulator, light-induced transcriptional regulator
MKTFSIAELEQYSLIRAHTFRTWEYRFPIFTSNRSKGNTRYYTIDDLSFLLDFALLNRLGSKVSYLAYLDKDTIREKVLQLKDKTARQESQINDLIIAMFSLNIEEVEKTLNNAVSWWGIDQAIEEIILPFIQRIELFSYKGRTSSEYHFVVTALRKKLILGIEMTNDTMPSVETALLFLPKGEHFDLLLLYLNYKLKQQGIHVLYLGTNVTSENVQLVLERKKPRYAVSYDNTENKNRNNQLAAFRHAKESELSKFIGEANEGFGYLLDKVKFMTYHTAEDAVVAAS